MSSYAKTKADLIRVRSPGYEIVDFDQAERDAIAEAIEQQKARLRAANAADRLEKMREVYGPRDSDIVEMFAQYNQAELNRLDRVSLFFTGYRFMEQAGCR